MKAPGHLGDQLGIDRPGRIAPNGGAFESELGEVVEVPAPNRGDDPVQNQRMPTGEVDVVRDRRSSRKWSTLLRNIAAMVPKSQN